MCRNITIDLFGTGGTEICRASGAQRRPPSAFLVYLKQLHQRMNHDPCQGREESKLKPCRKIFNGWLRPSEKSGLDFSRSPWATRLRAEIPKPARSEGSATAIPFLAHE